MVDEKTDFFQVIDNFAKTAHVLSIPIIESKLAIVPKVTIAIPTYKRADLLKEALDSAINQQDYLEYEIIVVDNNPERYDETERLMITYNDPKVSYYKNAENIQMAGNWNRLFTLAKGIYVIMLHDDDLLLPNFLSETVSILKKNGNIGMLKPKAYECDMRVHFPLEKTKTKTKTQKLKLTRILDISLYYGQSIGAPSGIIYKRTSVLELGGFNQDFYPTFDYCFNVLFCKYFEAYFYHGELSVYRVGCNESLKISTLERFSVNDFYLIRQLLESHRITPIIINGFLRHRTKNNAISNKKRWNDNFVFNMSILGIEPINSLLGILCHVLIRVYMYICLLKYCKK